MTNEQIENVYFPGGLPYFSEEQPNVGENVLPDEAWVDELDAFHQERPANQDNWLQEAVEDPSEFLEDVSSKSPEQKEESHEERCQRQLSCSERWSIPGVLDCEGYCRGISFDWLSTWLANLRTPPLHLHILFSNEGKSMPFGPVSSGFISVVQVLPNSHLKRYTWRAGSRDNYGACQVIETETQGRGGSAATEELILANPRSIGGVSDYSTSGSNCTNEIFKDLNEGKNSVRLGFSSEIVDEDTGPQVADLIRKLEWVCTQPGPAVSLTINGLPEVGLPPRDRWEHYLVARRGNKISRIRVDHLDRTACPNILVWLRNHGKASIRWEIESQTMSPLVQRPRPSVFGRMALATALKEQQQDDMRRAEEMQRKQADEGKRDQAQEARRKRAQEEAQWQEEFLGLQEHLSSGSGQQLPPSRRRRT